MADIEAALATTDRAGPVPEPRAKQQASASAPERMALPMQDKTDAGSQDLVEQLGAAALAGAISAAAPPADDSKSIHDRRFAVEVDHARDALLTDFGKETLDDRYLLPGERYQDLFARVADAYADDEAHAQRLYDYISRLWFMPATPVLSNGGTNRGLPISCYLNSVSDSLEGIVGTWNENVWLASRGGGIGTYWGNVRGIGPVGRCQHCFNFGHIRLVPVSKFHLSPRLPYNSRRSACSYFVRIGGHQVSLSPP